MKPWLSKFMLPAMLFVAGCEAEVTSARHLVPAEIEPGASNVGCTSGDCDTDGGPNSIALKIPDSTYPSPHASIPLLTYGGGALITAPEVVTVTFNGDSSREFLEQFGDAITSTKWWDAVSDGYCDSHGECIGRGTGGGHVHVPTAPAPSYEDTPGTASSSLKRYIAANVESGLFPAPNANTIYLLYFPNETTITLDGMASCEQFGAYHNAMTATPNGKSAPVTFAFVVIPRCQDGQNVLTLGASHELIEAATDPVYDAANNAYSGWGSSGDAWDYAYGGEAADRCVQVSSAGLPTDTYQEGAFLVQRSFSNRQAQASHDPCVPAPSPSAAPYFNVAPQAGDVLNLEVGQTVEISLTAFSDAPMLPFSISVAQAEGQDALNLILGTTTVQNGQVVKLSVTLKAHLPDRSAPFAITSTLGEWSHSWPFLVREH